MLVVYPVLYSPETRIVNCIPSVFTNQKKVLFAVYHVFYSPEKGMVRCIPCVLVTRNRDCSMYTLCFLHQKQGLFVVIYPVFSSPETGIVRCIPVFPSPETGIVRCTPCVFIHQKQVLFAVYPVFLFTRNRYCSLYTLWFIHLKQRWFNLYPVFLFTRNRYCSLYTLCFYSPETGMIRYIPCVFIHQERDAW